jgi:hypothetical protein
VTQSIAPQSVAGFAERETHATRFFNPKIGIFGTSQLTPAGRNKVFFAVVHSKNG